MDACSKASGNPLHKKIVDQIIAVDNFIAFKKLMIKRNQELNEQALQMLSGGGPKAPIQNQPQTIVGGGGPYPTGHSALKVTAQPTPE